MAHGSTRRLRRNITIAVVALVVAGIGAVGVVAHHESERTRPPTRVAGEQVTEGAPDYGSLPAPPAAPVVAMTTTPSGRGYWLVASDGGVFCFGDAQFFGSTGGLPLVAPIVDLIASARGYWLIAADGGVFSFGDAPFLGSMGGIPLNAPVVAGFGTPDRNGYTMVATDGGIFTFGSAAFHGSMGGVALNAPMVDAQSSPSGGYWMVAADGGVFTFGPAAFHGSLGATPLVAPITSLTPTPMGYRLIARDGGVFTFGNAPFFGSLGGYAAGESVVGAATAPAGYWLTSPSGRVFAFDAGSVTSTTPDTRVPTPTIGRVGPSDPAALTVTGPLTITRNGATVENVDVRGELRIAADDVTVRNFRANNVLKDPGRVRLMLVDGEINGAVDNTADGVGWSDYVAIRLDIHNVFDGLKAHGNVIIDNCWVHDLNFFTGSSAGAGGYSHNDAVQISSGSNVVIRNSRFERNQGNSAIFIDSDQGPIDNVQVTNNVIGGGGFTLYSIRSRSAPQWGRPTNVTIANNVFTEEHLFDYATIAPSGTAWRNNRNQAGALIQPRTDTLS